jgi:WD40 repeat protein
MRRLAPVLAASLALAACGSGPEPASDSPYRLTAERLLRLGDSPARELAFSGDGAFLATSNAAGMVALWPLGRRGRPRLIHQPPVSSLAVSSDGALVATGSYDGAVRLWRAADLGLLRTLPTGGGTLWSVALSPDGAGVAAGGEDKVVRIWRIADGTLLHRLAGHSLNIWKLAYSPDGRILASSSFDRDVRLWDSTSGAPLRVLKGHEQAAVGLAFSPDGKLVASSGDDSTIRLWRAADGAPLRTIAAGNHIYRLAFSPDGRLLASSGRARGGVGTFFHQLTGGISPGPVVRLWRVADGALLAAAPQPEDGMSIAYSPDGRWLATASEDGTATLWKIERR